MSEAGVALRSPPDVARETIRQLAVRKLSPTPENYAEVYGELSGSGATEPASVLQWLRQFCLELGKAPVKLPLAPLEKALVSRNVDQARSALIALCAPEATAKANPSRSQARPEWAKLTRDLLRQWDARQPEWTQARKRESVEHVLAAFGADAEKLAVKLGSLVKAWSERRTQGATDVALVDPVGGEAAPALPAVPAAVPTMAVASLVSAAATPAAAGIVAPGVGVAADTAVAPVTAYDLWPLTRDSAAATDNAVAAPATDGEAYILLRDLSAELMKLVIGDGQNGDERLVTRGLALIARLQSARGTAEFVQIAPAIRELLRQIELAQGGQRETVKGLLSLLNLIVGNIEELVPDERWVRGQVERLRCLIEEPLDARGLIEAEQAFRDVIARQGSIRKSLDEAKAALKDMLASFIERLGTMSDTTGGYQAKVQTYAERIEMVDDLSQLPAIIKGLLEDTRAVQADMLRAREELQQARQRATDYERQIVRLESELVDVSNLLKSDQLTGVLNRRGLNEAFTIESARSDRDGNPLCVALLDVDNFKSLNDTHGHDVGDRALQHLAEIVRRTVRPTDIVARYGGEEFVVVLPQTAIADAEEIMSRVQRQLTRNFFLQNNERLLITFSAGVTERLPNEPQSLAVTRADTALYQAKGTGKNKVVRI